MNLIWKLITYFLVIIYTNVRKACCRTDCILAILIDKTLNLFGYVILTFAYIFLDSNQSFH